jgi:hypothetical protein
MINYLTFHYRREQEIYARVDGVPDGAVARFKAKVSAFYAIASSGYGEAAANPGRIPHKCKDKNCCVSIVACKIKLSAAIMTVVLRCRPGLAIIAKWTKLGPVLDFTILGQQSNILQALFNQATDRFDFEKNTSVAAANEDQTATDAQWHKVAGSHMKRTKSLLGDQFRNVTIIFLAIVIEPQRVLHLWFLRAGHSVVDRARYPPLLSLSCGSVRPESTFAFSTIAGCSREGLLGFVLSWSGWVVRASRISGSASQVTTDTWQE